MSEFIEGSITPPVEAVELKKFKYQKSLEFDYYQGFQAACAVDAANWLKRIERACEAYGIVQQEESRRSAIVHTPTSDCFALVAIPPGQFGSNAGFVPQSGKSQLGASSGPIDRESLQCDHCHNTGHTKDFCWKLHGHPFRGRGGGHGGRGRGFMRSQAQAHFSESTIATLPDSGFNTGGQAPSDHVSGFSQGEMQALRRLMAWADSPSTIAPTSTTGSTSSYFAHTGTGHGQSDWQW
ncbi:uncharacterized protein LOC131302983 [Rhododendron vialii]|uniref:uncharacterized protein LOC131302983 n=1 Tax=Rhododendron vialii TaxID=182163 RepID=UPI00265EEEF1|nr:uncharacterized protein LOC131302983 [Rhododendron vialii]